MQWDARRSAVVVASLAGSVADPERRGRVQGLCAQAWERLAPLVPELRTQVGPRHGISGFTLHMYFTLYVWNHLGSH